MMTSDLLRASAPSPLPQLLRDLDAALAAKDRVVAAELEQAILRYLATEAAGREQLERLVRARVADLLRTPAAPKPLGPQELFNLRGPTYHSGAAPQAAPAGALLYPVLFATNRPVLADGTGFAATGRSAHTSRGRVEVYIPETHRFGETGNSYWVRMLRQRSFQPADDHLRVESFALLNQSEFSETLRRQLAEAGDSGNEPHALVFLHGYNTSFEEAAIRAAQIGSDLKVTGATAFFSWPSEGSVLAYPADEAAIEASERAITDFLVGFAAECGAAKVHIIAHSMGNRGLLRALQRMASHAETHSKVRFGQIFLAAPDVDHDLFLDLAELYPAFSERTTLYASRRDLPVHASAWVHRAPRAGYFEPYTVAPHVDTVAVPNFNLDLLGHSYFAQAQALLHDLYDLLRHNQSPAQRQRIDLAPTAAPDGAFWQLRR